MQRKTTLTRVALSPYSLDLWVLISNDPFYAVAEFNQKHKGLELSWGTDYSAITEDKLYKDSNIITVFDVKYCDPEVMAHEAIHVKNIVMKHSGWKHDINNDEPEAYLVGFIVKIINEALKEFKSKRK